MHERRRKEESAAWQHDKHASEDAFQVSSPFPEQSESPAFAWPPSSTEARWSAS
jgi:hypothetical protein